jgi:uncharacterized damage-inducible protein DinB
VPYAAKAPGTPIRRYGLLVDVNDLLTDAFGRLPDLVRRAVDGLSPEQLTWAPRPGANTIGWLIWHLTRIQDHHVSELLGEEQVWVTGAWPARFGLAADPDDTGYGHSPGQVTAVRPDGDAALVGYFDAVAARTRDLIARVTPEELDRVVDRHWQPPVTLGVRLVSVINDDVQHAGQAAYVRGLLAAG